MVYSGGMSIPRRSYERATLSTRGSCSSMSWARRVCRCTGSRNGSRAEKYNAVCSSCWRRFIRMLLAWLPRMCAMVRIGCG